MPFLHVGTSPKIITHANIHKHPCYEIILNTEGEGIENIGEHKQYFCSGSVHIIPKNTPHMKYSEKGFSDIFIQSDNLSPILEGILKTRPIFFDEDGTGILSSLIKTMLLRYLGGKKNDSLLISMYELILKLIEEKCTSRHVDPILEDIQRRFAFGFNDPELSLSRILESTGYNKDYIRRKFISEYGITPKEYLTFLRIENAKKLLKEQKSMRLSIAQIAVECGYYDSHYFSRAFKKSVGISPEKFASISLME